LEKRQLRRLDVEEEKVEIEENSLVLGPIERRRRRGNSLKLVGLERR